MKADARLSAALRHKAPEKPAKAPTPQRSTATAAKCGFSLFPADVQRIEDIRDALFARGRKISASHAVRLALRAMNADAATLENLLDAMIKEDGRTTRHTAESL